MDLKKRLLGRARSVQVTFLSKFFPVTLAENGTGELILPPEVIRPVDVILMVPINEAGVELYDQAIGCEATWVKTGNKLKLSKDGCDQLTAIDGSTFDVLVALPQVYHARRVSQLLPSEVRGMTKASADVMAMIAERDPEMVDRISEAIGQKVQEAGGTINQRALSSAIEAQINVELTMKFPDLLEEIEDLQTSQEAVKAAYMIGADVDFMRTVYMRVPEGDSMIRELMYEIDPPPRVDTGKSAELKAAEEEADRLAALSASPQETAPETKKTRSRRANVKVADAPPVVVDTVAVEVPPAPAPAPAPAGTAIDDALELDTEDEEEFELITNEGDDDDESEDDSEDDSEYEDDDEFDTIDEAPDEEDGDDEEFEDEEFEDEEFEDEEDEEEDDE